MKISTADIIIIVLISIVIVLASSIVVNDHKSKDFCISNGFDDGYTEKLIFSFNPYTVACYNICFDEDKGTHYCDKKFFIYGGS